jgi:crotonobetainyl-CoA:carnitine CoA-transferase CaiB-like acyl-CoA transferase
MLSPYRVLDLTDEKGLLCGKLLGDLGADVIKIERPGGDPARSIGPFYHDEVDPEKSLFWFAYNSSKRGVTLDIESPDGQNIFRKLVRDADFVIESFPPGYMDKLGLGYKALEALNPAIIMVSITPFGQTGPYKDFKTSDIVAWAMGGQMYLLGDEDRPPVRISHHSQAYLHASSEAAVGAVLALSHRVMTGDGQQVDVSVQASVARLAYGATLPWDMLKEIWRRGGRDIIRLNKDLKITRIWPCKDGQVLWFWFGGAQGYHNAPLVKWMETEGIADDFIREFDWETFDLRTTSQDVLDRLAEPTRRFFMSHTKAELLDGAVEHHVILYPISTTSDILESVQLAARDYWVELEHPELGAPITYPGAFVRSSEVSPGPSRRAPQIGEHNKEILEQELGISERGK